MRRIQQASYECPHCREALETRPGPWNGWLLCPRCGRPGMPPDPRPARIARRTATAPARGVFVTKAAAEPPPSFRMTSLAQISIVTMFSVISLIAYLDQLDFGTAAMALAAMALFGLLAKVGRK